MNLGQDQAAARFDLKDAQVGDNEINHSEAGDGERAFFQNLWAAVLGSVLHHCDHALYAGTRSIAPPGPFTILPGIIQLAISPLSVTSKAPRIARSMCPPRIIAKESALEKKAEPGRGDGLLAGVDQVGIDLVFGGEGSDA